MSSRKRSSLRRIPALIFAVALVVASCGSDDGAADVSEPATSDVTGDSTAAPAEEPAATSPEPGEEPSAEPAAEGDSLIIAISTEPSTLDGQVVNDRNARVITGNLFEALIKRDREALLVPGLATEWANVDDTTWEFTLREDVTYHDGSPFNAASAAYSVNRMVAEDFETQRGSYIKGIVGAEATGDFTLVVTTDGPDAILPLQMAQVPMVPLDAGDEMNDAPIGTGPYMLDVWARGQSITAVAYAGYWGDAPSIPSFTARVIPDAQTALAALQVGEIDLVLDILPDQIDLVPKTVSVEATEFSYLAFNTYKEELSDPNVRVAMNLAIDKETLAETLYSGYARPNEAQQTSSNGLGFNADIEPFPYDPDTARQLLADAGYPDGFSVTLNVPIGRYLYGEETAQYVAQQLGDIGLDVEIVSWEWNEYRSAGRVPGTENGAFDLKYGWNSNEWFDAARVRSHVTCGGGSSKICIPAVDEYYEIGATSLDQEVRDEAYQAAWAALRVSPHAIYLLQQDLLYGMSEDLQWEPRLDDEYFVSEMTLG
jgi:peptide/nickel transport system substrate-binding protein